MNKEALDYKADTEQPNCEGCEFFKHTDKFDHCYRYTEARSLCKLRQPVEQPPASDFTKECRDKFSDQLDYDCRWNILCGKAFNEACTRLDRSEAGERILEERIEKLSDTLDRSETSREELLTALEEASSDFYYIHRHSEDAHVDSYNFMEKAKKAIKKGD